MTIEFAKIENFLPSTVRSTLLDGGRFADIAHQTALLIEEKTGLATDGPMPEWALLPAAWIIGYIAAERFGNMSAELLDRTRTNYNNAIRLLETKRTNTVRNARRGQFGGGVQI